jgi:hypothetical protein
VKRIMRSYVDERLRWPEDACVHCGNELDAGNITQEHIPSKCLLMKPYPEELMTLAACGDCNADFSIDEEYLSALLTAVLAGSADPDRQKTPRAAHMFGRREGLRARIEEVRTETKRLFGETEITFSPELERVNRVIVKNARCHAIYDLDRWTTEDPDSVVAVPLQNLSQQQQEQFELVESGLSPWAEVGTRMFQRECLAVGSRQSDMRGSWVIVQEDVYRYAIADMGDGLLVRSVMQEYLATEAYWSDGKY